MAQDSASTDEKEVKQSERSVEFYFDGKRLSKQDHILLFEYMGDISQQASSKLKNFIYKASKETQGLMNQPLNKWLIDDKLHSKEPDSNGSNYDFGARARIPIIFGDSKYVRNRFPFETKNEDSKTFHVLQYQTIIYLLIDGKPSKTQLSDKALIVHGTKQTDLVKCVENWISNMQLYISQEKTVKINIEEFL